MNRKLVLVMALALVLIGMLTLTFNIQSAKAPNGTIYIRADGSIEPIGAPIDTADNITYTFIDDIYSPIVVERDNIIIDGADYTVHGLEEEGSVGIQLSSRTNITIKNTNIEKFNYGIYINNCRKIVLDGNNASYNKLFVFMDPFMYYWTGTGFHIYRSTDIVLSNNNVTNNISGIAISSCNKTLVVGNNASGNRELEDSTYVGGGISLSDTRNVTLMNNMVSGNGAVGIGVGSGIAYSSCNNIIYNNTIIGAFGTSYGITVSWSRNNTIAENTILANTYGIQLRYYTKNHTIQNNNISQNTWGVYLEDSPSNTIVSNTISRNAYGIEFENASHNDALYNNVSGNTGQAINVRGGSRNNVLLGNNVSNNAYGVRFVESRNNYIFWNSILSNKHTGLTIYYYSNNNTVASNNITSNVDYGITISYHSYNNKIFHNNFIDNTRHVYTDMNSTWDNGYPSGGNYWSNYTDSDFYSGSLQNEAGSDGIGDNPHIINANNTDNYPLMAPINTFDAGIWNHTARYIDIVSNSTISNFQLSITGKTISFNVTGEIGWGFCRVIIPNVIVEELWQSNYTVLVNGEPVEFRNWTDGTYTYIYFAYQHSDHTVLIVPEFPTGTSMLLLLIVFIVAIALYRRRLFKTSTH